MEGGGGLHHQDVADRMEGGLGRETEQKRLCDADGNCGIRGPGAW